MGTYIRNIKEDLTSVVNIQGLETNPIGLRSNKIRKDKKTTLKKLKDSLIIK